MQMWPGSRHEELPLGWEKSVHNLAREMKLT